MLNFNFQGLKIRISLPSRRNSQSEAEHSNPDVQKYTFQPIQPPGNINVNEEIVNVTNIVSIPYLNWNLNEKQTKLPLSIFLT